MSRKVGKDARDADCFKLCGTSVSAPVCLFGFGARGIFGEF